MMLVEMDTSVLDDSECKKCNGLCLLCTHDNAENIPSVSDIKNETGIDLLEFVASKTLSDEYLLKCQQAGLELVDLQEFRDKTEITACTLGFLWKDLLNRVDKNGSYKFICRYKYNTCDGDPGFWCFYHNL